VISAKYLRQQAWRCRSLAASTTDTRAAGILRQMAIEYEAEAKRIEETEAPLAT
jgi:hypothetical protein